MKPALPPLNKRFRKSGIPSYIITKYDIQQAIKKREQEQKNAEQDNKTD